MHDVFEEEYGPALAHREGHHHAISLNCSFCTGTGVHPSTMHLLEHSACPVCEGTGLMSFKGDLDHCLPCIRCGSSGREPDSSPLAPCSSCAGHGVK